jgi:hypothetical protein
MGITRFVEKLKLRRGRRELLRDIQAWGIHYTQGEGDTLDDPIVITGAEYDLVGTKAIIAWLSRRYGVLGVDWRVALKSGGFSEERQIDEYDIELSSGAKRQHFFDITESYCKWPSQ